jgi:hypothetical protein
VFSSPRSSEDPTRRPLRPRCWHGKLRTDGARICSPGASSAPLASCMRNWSSSWEFKPEYAGKMNFYPSGVDAQLRGERDHPSNGLVLCKEKNKVVVEYALRDTKKPIGVSAYRLLEKLPAKLKGSLPTVEQLEAELGGR